jgi:enoyl-CoA hydratase
MSGAVHASIDGPVATLALSNPDKRNATSKAMYAAIPAAVSKVRVPSVRVVVLRGEGELAFGAGSDIAEFRTERRGEAARVYNEIEHEACAALQTIDVPVLALIHGPCMGGGLGLALCADLRYAADDAQFGVPPGRLGLGYPFDSAARLVLAVGFARARELLLTARRVDATEAVALGLVHTVVPKADLEAHVSKIARDITRLAPGTLAAAKATFRALEQPSSAHLRAAADASIDGCFASDDYDEGIRAFLEKRAPVFDGR